MYWSWFTSLILIRFQEVSWIHGDTIQIYPVENKSKRFVVIKLKISWKRLENDVSLMLVYLKMHSTYNILVWKPEKKFVFKISPAI